ncbi:hypothetical protein [Abyssisolibacter fermentans]|uniref:hypothetical protein n=1 Tax=Abyssisolibacter fermentans TaxID=1766203 RepID=UPI0008302101|nr:hypothetical protein [Abyssisolibacter fermentans]
MRKNKKFLVILCTFLLILLSGLLTAFAWSPFDNISKQYSESSETSIMDTLSEKNFKEICEEINVLSQNKVKLSDMLYHASTLAEKVDTISEEELISEISDVNNSSNLRTILIQLCKYKNNMAGIKDETQLKVLLLDEKTDLVLRQNIVWVLSDSEDSMETLTSVAYDKDDLLAFQAIKRLNCSFPATARKIANEILQKAEQDKEQGEKLRVAIKVKAEQFRKEESNRSDKDDFINFCIDIFNNSNDEIMQDTVVFALSSMKDKEAITTIIENEKIDSDVKAYCIDQNYETLAAMLENNLCSEDIETVIKAMNIYPVEGVVSALEKHIEQNRNNYNFSELKQQEVNPVNEKWRNY